MRNVAVCNVFHLGVLFSTYINEVLLHLHDSEQKPTKLFLAHGIF